MASKGISLWFTYSCVSGPGRNSTVDNLKVSLCLIGRTRRLRLKQLGIQTRVIKQRALNTTINAQSPASQFRDITFAGEIRTAQKVRAGRCRHRREAEKIRYLSRFNDKPAHQVEGKTGLRHPNEMATAGCARLVAGFPHGLGNKVAYEEATSVC